MADDDLVTRKKVKKGKKTRVVSMEEASPAASTPDADAVATEEVVPTEAVAEEDPPVSAPVTQPVPESKPEIQSDTKADLVPEREVETVTSAAADAPAEQDPGTESQPRVNLSTWTRRLKEKNDAFQRSLHGKMSSTCSEVDREVRQLQASLHKTLMTTQDISKNVRVCNDNVTKLISSLKDVDEYVRPIVLQD
eukprot:CAMPEP_0114540916 /NCGR_PEP_ID=MMETSP0114-20121206/1026_1 /TAXON_ID=31324 /ORGANISM="Goniomonas sp, Strain m" /LENGTH=193 /DNA_ID=CAMNT_0001725117 /DNA_START=7 /DNA_END=585 /DNA_ORIENTATION=-